MYYYLKGVIAGIEPGFAVVDCGGVGFCCNTSQNTMAALTVGETATLYTYLYVREDIMDLYGFATREELSCFKLLINISGVGPKAAVSILSAVTPGKLAVSVVTGDDKMLMCAQGVGKKLAQRIILELKDKVAKSLPEMSSSDIAQISSPSGDDAIQALAVLGYSPSEARMALDNIDATLPTEEKIRLALKKLMR